MNGQRIDRGRRTRTKKTSTQNIESRVRYTYTHTHVFYLCFPFPYVFNIFIVWLPFDFLSLLHTVTIHCSFLFSCECFHLFKYMQHPLNSFLPTFVYHRLCVFASAVVDVCHIKIIFYKIVFINWLILINLYEKLLRSRKHMNLFFGKL